MAPIGWLSYGNERSEPRLPKHLYRAGLKAGWGLRYQPRKSIDLVMQLPFSWGSSGSVTSRRMRARVAENSLNGIEFQDEKLTPRLGIGRWMIIRSYQITRVVHRSRISERKIYSEHVANDL